MDVKFDDCRTAKSNDPSRSIVVDDYSVHDEPVKPVVITDKLAATITPLDNTWIHPEQYGAAYSLIEASGTALKMFGSEEFRERIKTFCAGVDGNALAAQLRVDSQTLKLIVDGLTLSLGIFLRHFCPNFFAVFLLAVCLCFWTFLCKKSRYGCVALFNRARFFACFRLR